MVVDKVNMITEGCLILQVDCLIQSIIDLIKRTRGLLTDILIDYEIGTLQWKIVFIRPLVMSNTVSLREMNQRIYQIELE